MNDLKEQVYKLLGVTTTREVKKKYPQYKLNAIAGWQAIINLYTEVVTETVEEPYEIDDTHGYYEHWGYVVTEWSDGVYVGCIPDADLTSEGFTSQYEAERWAERQIRELVANAA